MPIQGFIRFRKHQVGKETTFASNTPATRRLPYRGAINVEPNASLRTSIPARSIPCSPPSQAPPR